MSSRLHELNKRRIVGYTVLGLFLILYMSGWLAYAIADDPPLFIFSHYSVDYTLGFVRRGLGGEILDLFPTALYFTAQWTLRWLVSALFIMGLVAVAWKVAPRFGRSERRLMLDLLLPVLPFGFARAVFLPLPELLGGAVLAVFAVLVASAQKKGSILLASVFYGLCIAVLTLIHEAVPLLLSLGAILAIVLLGADNSIKFQRLNALVAVAPGLVVALAIGWLGRRDVSPECARLPHKALDWPPAGNLTLGQVLSGRHYYVDYHDWTCRNSIKKMDATLGDAIHSVARVDAAPMIVSTVFGIVAFAITIWGIRSVSGVPVRRFCDALRGRLVWVTFAAVLLVPIFVAGVDWIRWWVTISFDVGVVYLLYASNQPEATQPPARRTRVIFVVALFVSALLPIGTFMNVGMR